VKDPLGWPAATAITALLVVLGAIGIVWAHDAEPGWAVGLVLTGVGAVATGAAAGYAAGRSAYNHLVAKFDDEVTRAEERGEEAAYRRIEEYIDARRTR
jgi:multisubunit Na+/H+ antiporter MnhG subunit